MQQVAIYRNLRKNCLSIQSRESENYGKIIGYCKSIFLKRPKFIVREKSRLRVLKEGRKNVHAFVVGVFGRVATVFYVLWVERLGNRESSSELMCSFR